MSKHQGPWTTDLEPWSGDSVSGFKLRGSRLVGAGSGLLGVVARSRSIWVEVGVSARALMDDISLLRKLESRARMQMNSVQAIAGLLEAGLGCAIGTPLFMEEQLLRGVVGYRLIDSPELLRTLYLCELASRPPTFAMEAVRGIVLDLIEEAVTSGRWQARLLNE